MPSHTPKNHGLSLLADNARELAGGPAYYLHGAGPNWVAILSLENDPQYLRETEITETTPRGDTSDGLNVQATRGSRIHGGGFGAGYPRPMFEVLPAGFTAHGCHGIYYEPCPACLDFSRSWNCPDHHGPTWEVWVAHWGGGEAVVEAVEVELEW